MIRGGVQEPAQFSVTLTAAAAGDYAANDIVSNSAVDGSGVAGVITGVGPAGSLAILDGINAVCSEDSVVMQLRIHFYNYNPAAADVELDDNAVADFAKNATGAAGYLGYAGIAAMTDRGTAMAHGQVNSLNLPLKLGSTQNLYYVVQTVSAETNETAGMTIRFDFTFKA